MRARLPNGLGLILRPFGRAPVVALQAWVGVGAADEADTEAGLAHVLEHMLFKGTTRRPVGALGQAVEAAGGDLNAWTSHDETVYHLTLPARELPLGLDVLADMLRAARLDPAELERERAVILDEIRRGEDAPAQRLADALFGLAFSRHPYGRPIIGSAGVVATLTRAALERFYRRQYCPSNVTVTLVGPFDPAAARAAVARAFGGWSGRPRARPRRPREPRVRPFAARVLTGPQAETHFQLGWRIPPFAHEDTAALDLLAAVLGQGENARLIQRLKYQAASVNDVWAYAFSPRDPGLLVVGGATDAARCAAAMRGLEEECAALTSQLVSRAELEAARTQLASDADRRGETAQGVARALGSFQSLTGDPDYERRYLEQLALVTPERLRAAARRYLVPTGAAACLLAPAGQRAAAQVALRRHGARASTAHGGRVMRPRARQLYDLALPGGRRLLVRVDASAPTLALWAAFPGGQRAEPRPGLDNLVASLLTRATRRRSRAEVAARLDALAADVTGFCGRNSVGLRADLLAREREEALDLLLECLSEPAFAEPDLAIERALVLEELRARADDPQTLAYDLVHAALFAGHPLGGCPLGTPASVRALDAAALQARHRSLLHGPAVLAAAGDVEPLALAGRLRAVFSALPALPPRRARRLGPGRARVVWRELEREQLQLVLAFRSPALPAADRWPLELLAGILGGQAGRLFMDLRERRGLAYSVGCHLQVGLDPGVFSLYVACAPEQGAAALAALAGHVRAVVDAPVTSAELQRARRALIGAQQIGLQGNQARAAALALDTLYGLGPREHERLAQRVRLVSAEQVCAAARRHLLAKGAVVALVGPGARRLARQAATDLGGAP